MGSSLTAVADILSDLAEQGTRSNPSHLSHFNGGTRPLASFFVPMRHWAAIKLYLSVSYERRSY